MSIQVIFKNRELEATVTDDLREVHEWIRETYQRYAERNDIDEKLLIGLDTQSKPDEELDTESESDEEEKYANVVAVLQLCYKKRVLIYHIIYSKGIPFSLIQFLNDKSITFSGVSTRDDLCKLQRYGIARGGERYREFFLSQVKDLQDEAKYHQKDLTTVLKDLTGLEIETDMSLSDWEAPQLSENQVEYACVNAYASYLIGKPKHAEKYALEETCKYQMLE